MSRGVIAVVVLLTLPLASCKEDPSAVLTDAGAALLGVCQDDLAACVRDILCCPGCRPACEGTPGIHDRICDYADTCAEETACVSQYEPCRACINEWCSEDTDTLELLAPCQERYDRCALDAWNATEPDSGAPVQHDAGTTD